MSKKIVIIGAGFAGVWSALSAKRLLDSQDWKKKAIEVVVIAPEPALVIRPRLYEANPSGMSAPLTELFKSLGINFVQGVAKSVDTDAKIVQVELKSGMSRQIAYDRLVIAAGSAVIRPESITGLNKHAFDIDSLDAATKLDAHLEQLAKQPATKARDTIVVCGAGFTGLEIVTELPKRTAHMSTKPRLVLVDGADVLGDTLGPRLLPVLTQATQELGIEVKLGSCVKFVDAEGIVLDSGERIESKTVIWTAGVKATPLTQQIPGPKDNLNRLLVNEHLRVTSVPHVFATGDAAAARADDHGHYTMMSCQHAIPMGRASGFNAAADLLGLALFAYSQPEYVTCLDLGAWGTVVTEGWEREIRFTGDVAKKGKMFINQKVIYPPVSAGEAMGMAVPGLGANPKEIIERMVDTVSQELRVLLA